MIGTKVTVIEMMSEILPMMDGEFAKLMRRELKEWTSTLAARSRRLHPIPYFTPMQRERRNPLQPPWS
jgi:dihydrolipoamide dehydrogenase